MNDFSFIVMGIFFVVMSFVMAQHDSGNDL